MQKQHSRVAQYSFIAAMVSLSAITHNARADIALLDKDDWRVGFSGFAEFDSITDSTRSLGEISGNSAIAFGGTSDTGSGRTQFSTRNSRFGFNISAPATSSGWKSKGVLEFDFIPTASIVTTSSTAASNTTEGAGFNNPAMRIRHSYFATENNGLQFLAGQTWSLFGWQPAYVMSTISIAPVSGQVFGRHTRVGVMKTVDTNDTNQIQIAASASRPAQRDGDLPNLDLGARWSNSARKSGYTGTYGDIKTQPMSLGVSTTTRKFHTVSTTLVGDNATTYGSGFAVDAMIPVIASSDGKDTGNTLSFSGEYTSGKGYADMLSGWTGGSGAGTYGSTNNYNYLDAGFGAMNALGAFEFFELKTFNFQAQYTMPSDWHSFMNAGYGQLFSNNAGDFVGGTAGGGSAAAAKPANVYDKSETYFANILHDFTPQIRGGFELAQFRTHYVSGITAIDNRFMFSTWFRF